MLSIVAMATIVFLLVSFDRCHAEGTFGINTGTRKAAQGQQTDDLPVTVAHSILKLESRFGASAGDEIALNVLLGRARERLPAMPAKATARDAIKCLEAIRGFLKEEGYRYEITSFLFEALRTKRSDCDTTTLIYCAIGETMGYPLGAVILPRHAFVRWTMPQGDVLNWETTSDSKGASFSDGSYYESLLGGMTGEGCNLRTLTREQLPAIHHFMAGLAFAAQERFDDAVKEHDAALKLEPAWYMSRLEESAIHIRRQSFAAGANETLKAMEYLPVDSLGQAASTAIALAVLNKQEQDLDRKQLGRIVDGFMRHDSDVAGYIVLNAMEAFLSDRASSAIADLDGACTKWPTNFVPFLCRGALRQRRGDSRGASEDFAAANKILTAGRASSPASPSAPQSATNGARSVRRDEPEWR